MTTVFTTTTTSGSGGGGGGQYVIGRKQQVFPVRLRAEYEDEPISQRLVDAAHVNDLQLVLELVSQPSVDVNFVGTVCLKSRRTEVVLNGELASEVRIEFEEFRTDVTALFLAAHNGNVTLVRKLLNVGANVNQKLFRGYATTAAVREGHIEVLEMLLNGGAAQAACEEALLEACYLGRARPAELLMGSDMIRPHVAVHALVTASSRGFVDFVETLIKNGVDANANARILLQSSKPSLHANVDCNALVSAIVNRQASVVQLLLKVGCRTDTKVRLGAWSWDVTTGEEFRVGAGLAEPYHVTWCAVEYFEASGFILRMLLQYLSPNIPHLGRTIIHHAILCGNARAFEVLLSCRADIEFPVETTQHTDYRPIHLAARLGLATILRLLINAGCNLNSRTGSGETALMICARHKQEECLKLLASAGSDFGWSNMSNQCAMSIAGSVRWTLGFQQAVLDMIRAGKIARSSNPEIFSSLLFVTRANDVEALKKLIKQPDMNLNEKDESGFSAVMVAAAAGHVETFRLLVNAGADVETHNKYGETAISLAQANQNSDAFAKVLSAYVYTKGNSNCSGSSALHRAARLSNLDLVRELANEGYDVNVLDCDGYTPLMLAARSGDGSMCELLISCGAKCDIKNARHETALSLARKGSGGNDAERVILDELARRLVLSGAQVKKHTKAGKGAPHVKMLKMVEAGGVLRWGKSSKRNVICRGAEVGPSSAFRWNRRKKSDADDPGVFRVVTTKNKEIHFSCQGETEMARLWVRGIRLVTREAIFGRNFGGVLDVSLGIS
ncbi:hypothetical protein Pfo_009275 [Paulownia fortunei]|nr:hypothetical protein Pfo_009275 [Paulownia fortunei]